MKTTPETSPVREDVTQAIAGCPFCTGKAALDQFHPTGLNEWRVICDGCEAWGPERKTAAEAIAAWNARLAHTARPDDTDRLRKALIEIGNMIPGCALADTVSTDFLMLIPAEVRAWKDKLSARPDAGDEVELRARSHIAYLRQFDSQPMPASVRIMEDLLAVLAAMREGVDR